MPPQCHFLENENKKIESSFAQIEIPCVKYKIDP